MRRKNKWYIICVILVGMLLMGCGAKAGASEASQPETSSAIEEMEEEEVEPVRIEEAGELEEVPIEGMENMTDEEINEELIRQVDEMPIVPDKKE